MSAVIDQVLSGVVVVVGVLALGLGALVVGFGVARRGVTPNVDVLAKK